MKKTKEEREEERQRIGAKHYFCDVSSARLPTTVERILDPRVREMIPLAQGEIDLIRRALRIYAHNEQRAISDAATGRDNAHAEDVRRQNQPRIKAAGELADRLLHDPLLTGKSRYRG